jgi:sugar phosphate isomerase/epimerase
MAPLSLSTSWNASRHREGEPMLREMRELGFDRVELSHNIRYHLYAGIVKAVDAGIVAVSSVHNFCPVPPEALRPSPNCFQFSDERAETRRLAVKRTLETLDFAARIKAPAVVLHLGWAGPRGISAKLERAWERGRFLDRRYVRAKVAAVAERRAVFDTVYGRVRPCLEEIVPAARERGLRLGFECREDYAEFPDEVEMERLLADFPTDIAGYWHDFGHAQAKEFLGWHDHAATLGRWAGRGRLLGCHIHDCAPPGRDHLPLGKGATAFALLAPLVPEGAVRVLELSPRVTPADVIKSKETWNSYAAASASSLVS